MAAKLLQAHGFIIVARNERGDSLYLALQGQDATLRLSSHARRPRQRRTHPEVVTSLVVATPKRGRQLSAMIAAAQRDYAARTTKGPVQEERPFAE
ncbi:hypothetical protein [Methylobacterium sp. J-070]|uniref:hypothetical protein n=1 Tax=Methylobacterium sp. J-070 TaxID=2836650 RepID=UPI001FB96B07|nr:hypothetical protein [Methylobacterium sp. J-070]MCJ2053233.1 hypothetical protein [Methylobacterium sp. J-070]